MISRRRENLKKKQMDAGHFVQDNDITFGIDYILSINCLIVKTIVFLSLEFYYI
jgi:hypothetical protein